MMHEKQPSLAGMLNRYLRRSADAQAAGLGGAEPEVVPFESAPVQPIDSRQAWDEALATWPGEHPAPPPDWSAVVAAHEPVMALAFALGNFPQLVRDLHGLLHADDLTRMRPPASRPVAAAALLDWADHTLRRQLFPQALLAVGVLRLAGHFEAADHWFRQVEAPTDWKEAWANEQAALAWHQGKTAEAAQLWLTLPDSLPVLFNRGMSALFLGRHTLARKWLTHAVSLLPETGAWHHLARLYLTLAELHGYTSRGQE